MLGTWIKFGFWCTVFWAIFSVSTLRFAKTEWNQEDFYVCSQLWLRSGIHSFWHSEGFTHWCSPIFEPTRIFYCRNWWNRCRWLVFAHVSSAWVIQGCFWTRKVSGIFRVTFCWWFRVILRAVVFRLWAFKNLTCCSRSTFAMIIDPAIRDYAFTGMYRMCRWF